MKTLNFPTSACRYCHYYQPEGRRGGMCQQLSAPVRGSWKACSLALPAFASSLERIAVIWEDETLGIKETLSINGSLTSSKQDLSGENSLSTSEKLEAEAVLL